MSSELSENNNFNFKKADYQEETKPDGRYEVIHSFQIKRSFKHQELVGSHFVLFRIDGELLEKSSCIFV